MNEREITCSVAQYLNLKRLVFTHVANERKCTPRQGSYLKKMGLCAGVTDFIVFTPGDSYSLLLLEIKTIKGKLSESQKNFKLAIESKCPDILWKCSYGLDDSLNIINEYLYGN